MLQLLKCPGYTIVVTAAATAKALVPMTVFVRCTTSFMVSADRKCRRLRTVAAKKVIGQVLWGQTMDAFEDCHGHLKVRAGKNLGFWNFF